ncbi:MAG: iron-containing alcohol dehydrogenase [Candidatus Thorarchaeota archaeon]
MWSFTSPRHIILGEDALEYLSLRRFEHAFVVTDPIMRELHLDTLTNRLNGTKITVFDKLPKGETTIHTVRNGAKKLAEAEPDVIIALGGGSVMDAAKGMWVMWADPGTDIGALNPLEPIHLRKKTKAELINIPTTSGTGSDVTWAVVLQDTDEKLKISLANRELVADISILDPGLAATMPPHMIAGTGFDALCHSIDGYLSTWQNDFSDALLRHAFKLVWENLTEVYERAARGDPIDPKAREKLHHAATMAGWGMSNSQIILTHSLAHALGGVFRLPHALLVGASGWYSLMFNREVAARRIVELAEIVKTHASNQEETVIDFIGDFKAKLIQCHLPISLKEMSISRESFEQNLEILVMNALNDTGSLSNPREIQYQDVERIFHCMWDGNPVEF